MINGHPATTPRPLQCGRVDLLRRHMHQTPPDPFLPELGFRGAPPLAGLDLPLPLRQWYLDTSSVWTLDYPPLFAHFSYLLSLPASLFDPAITSLSSGATHTPGTVLYLRLTAALCDLSLFLASYLLISTSRCSLFTLALILWSPTLFIVDHVHFQYNGFLLGIFLLSLGFLEEGRDLAGGFLFAVSLCSKHLFLVAVPFYFLYLLRHYCKGGFFRGFSQLVVMGMAVAAVFAVSFGPFYLLWTSKFYLLFCTQFVVEL